MTTTKTINIIMGLEDTINFLEQSDLPIDRHINAIGEAIRVLESHQGLYDTIKEYQKWVKENHPGDLDDDGSGFAAFDEERADWWQSIAAVAENAVGL